MGDECVPHKMINDMFLVGTPNGVMLTKSVRRSSQPWELEKKLADNQRRTVEFALGSSRD